MVIEGAHDAIKLTMTSRIIKFFIKGGFWMYNKAWINVNLKLPVFNSETARFFKYIHLWFIRDIYNALFVNHKPV